jgi:hypothetical protein
MQPMLRDSVAGAGDAGVSTRERVAPIIRPGLERELGMLLGRAAFLRNAAHARARAAAALPPFPAVPRSPRSPVLVKAVVAGAVAGAVVLAAESLNIAKFVFGAPLRPALVGHKVGSPSHPVPSTLTGPQAPPGP